MNQNQKAANTQKVYEVTAKDLPVCCPMPDMQTWNSHPRVFLTFDDNGKARCPYCGAEYHLVK